MYLEQLIPIVWVVVLTSANNIGMMAEEAWWSERKRLLEHSLCPHGWTGEQAPFRRNGYPSIRRVQTARA